MENNYYNTNNEKGKELKDSNNKVKTQEEIILAIFKNKKKLSASAAWNIYDGKGITPITSIRRAITNLCNAGKLIKTDEMSKGIYGKKEHIYILFCKNEGEQLMIF